MVHSCVRARVNEDVSVMKQEGRGRHSAEVPATPARNLTATRTLVAERDEHAADAADRGNCHGDRLQLEARRPREPRAAVHEQRARVRRDEQAVAATTAAAAGAVVAVGWRQRVRAAARRVVLEAPLAQDGAGRRADDEERVLADDEQRGARRATP